MEWWLIVTLLFGGLLVAFFSNIAIGISFLLLDIIAMYFVVGPGFSDQLVRSIYDSLVTFSLTPIPLFVFMGAVLFNSGLALRALDSIEKWLGRIPGRLSILSILSGALFASLSGSTIANTAMLGSLLAPEMQRRKYHTSMIVGPIVASGSLAMMIPPSSLTVVFGSLAEISVGDLLVAGLVPGLMMAGLYVVYTVGRCVLDPTLAPRYDAAREPLGPLLVDSLRNVLPLAIIIFLTVGVIILGMATATEAAGLGALATVVLGWVLGDLSWSRLSKSMMDSLRVTAMILLIVAGSTAFSQVLAFSGATRDLLELVGGLPLSSFGLLLGMLAVVLVLGMFIEEVSIMMITLPIFMPIVGATHIDPLWFGILMLLVLDISLLTPPVGLLLYTMKGVAPAGITMADIWRGAFPYVICGLIAVAIVLKFPGIVHVLTP